MIKMKLSDAIRLGSMLRPRQVFFEMTRGEDGACALGAAEEAGYNTDVLDADMPKHVTCPVCGDNRSFSAFHYNYGAIYMISSFIIHLNDRHRWTREAIADYLDKIHFEEDAAVAQPEEASVGV